MAKPVEEAFLNHKRANAEGPKFARKNIPRCYPLISGNSWPFLQVSDEDTDHLHRYEALNIAIQDTCSKLGDEVLINH